MDPEQILRVVVHFEGSWRDDEKFYAHMSRDGRITIPKLAEKLLKEEHGGQDMAGVIFEVELAPSKAMLEAQDKEDY